MSSQNTKIENNLKNEQNFENVDKNDQNLDKNEQNFENVDKNDQNLDKNEQNFENVDKNDQNLVKNEQNSEKPDKENEKINECLETAIKTLHSTIKKEILDEKLSKLLETSTSNPENNKKLPNFPFSLLPKKIKIENLEKDISIINKLVDSVSRDFEFLRDELREVIKEDSFVERLFGIYSDTFEMDLMRGHPAININRADFFFDEKAQSYFLVEINTISCGYSGISAHMVDFHAFK
ncbi:Glutathione synthetase [Bonamia ostreae]|uniref:Glutathione synthetase n=1 Tax=Bonamia ostreae TaxID=126728 RepID=A0ABV2AFH5_9EUKA